MIQIKRFQWFGVSACKCRWSRAEADRWRSDVGRAFKIAIAVTASWIGLIPCEEVRAVDLAGAWATDADQCRQVFVRKGRARQVGFAALSEQHGGGFIVEADRRRGKFATCRIKSRKEDGETVNILAGCTTDIMLSNVQFSLKLLEPNRISRIFPGIPEMEISYYRCPI